MSKNIYRLISTVNTIKLSLNTVSGDFIKRTIFEKKRVEKDQENPSSDLIIKNMSYRFFTHRRTYRGYTVTK